MDVLAHSSEGKSVSKKAPINQKAASKPWFHWHPCATTKQEIFCWLVQIKHRNSVCWFFLKQENVRIWHRQLFKVCPVYPHGLLSIFLAIQIKQNPLSMFSGMLQPLLWCCDLQTHTWLTMCSRTVLQKLQGRQCFIKLNCYCSLRLFNVWKELS